jgi:hypothetical protein
MFVGVKLPHMNSEPWMARMVDYEDLMIHSIE